MLFGQVEVKAPQLLPCLVHTHNPRSLLQNWRTLLNSSLHCIKTRRGILYFVFFLLNFFFFLKKKYFKEIWNVTAVWAVNLSMKAHFFPHGQSKTYLKHSICFFKKSLLLLEFWEKGFVESCHSDQWQIFENQFSLDLKQHTRFTIKQYVLFILLYLEAKYRSM